jgi:hypothetical protein
MFKKKENRILFIINLILLLFILLFFAAGKNSTSIKTEKTSLLNNKYIPLIDTIIIQDPAAGSNLVLNKNELMWIGKTGEGLTFPSRISIPEMLQEMSRVRSVQKISNSIASWASFDLQQEQALSITFKNSITQEIYSTLYFGSENFNGSKIYFRTDKSSVFQTQNDLYTYLSDSILWCDTGLIPSYTGITEKSVQKIILKVFTQDGFQIKEIDSGSDLFSSYINRLLLSTGKPVFYQSETPVMNIYIENGNASEFSMNVFYNEANQLYYIVHDNTLFTYSLEISEWTYSSLIKPFSQ